MELCRKQVRNENLKTVQIPEELACADTFCPLILKVEFDLDGKSQTCMLPARSFIPQSSHHTFHQCTSNDPEVLAVELQNALKELERTSNSPNDSAIGSELVTCTMAVTVNNSDDTEANKQSETSQEPPKSKQGKRKSPSNSASATTSKRVFKSTMQESCEKCLVTSKLLVPVESVGVIVFVSSPGVGGGGWVYSHQLRILACCRGCMLLNPDTIYG